MKQEQQSLITMLKEQRSVRKRMAVAVCLVAILTVFAVFWALRISGQTMEENATETSATEADATETDSSGEDAGIETWQAYGISLASEDGDDTDSTSSETSSSLANYYEAETVELSELESDTEYIVYTKILDTTDSDADENGYVYYIVSSDESLLKCTAVNSLSDIAEDGLYYVSGEGKFVLMDSATGYAEYCWTVTDDSANSGAYYIYSADTGRYLAPASEGDLVIGTAFTAHTGEMTLSGDFKVVYTFTNRCIGSNVYENYIVEMVSDGVYLDVRADNISNAAWTANASENDSFSLDNEYSSDSSWLAVMQAGATVTVTIEKEGSKVQVIREVDVNETTYTFTATATMTEFENAEVKVYLTGENCIITDVSYTAYSLTSETDDDGNVTYSQGDLLAESTASVSSVYSSNKKTVKLTADTTDTSGAMVSYSYLSVLLDNDTSSDSGDYAVTWASEDDSDSTLYYFAEVTTDTGYSFADEVTLQEASENLGEDYIVYTYIDNTYYVVSAEGSLEACTYIGKYNDTTAAEFLSATSGSGVMYCWSDSDGNISFKYTSADGSDGTESYRWVLDGTDTDSSSGTGTYTLYNSENSVYLTPQDEGISQTISGIGWWNAANETSEDYLLDGTTSDLLVITVECTAQCTSVDELAVFNVELYDTSTEYEYSYEDDNGTTVSGSSCEYITTGTDYGAWYYPDGIFVDESITAGTAISKSYDSTYASAIGFTPEAGKTYIITVSRAAGSTDDVVSYVITYYDSDGNALLTFICADTILSSTSVYVHIIAQAGTYNISAVSMLSKAVAGTENEDQTDTEEATIDLTGLSAISTNESYRLNQMTLKGDFDITYQFYNDGEGNSTSGATSSDGKDHNYVLALYDSTNGYVYVKPSYEYILPDDAAIIAYESGEEPSNWVTFSSIMNAGYSSSSSYTMCRVNVVRQRNVITITAEVYRNSTTTPTYSYKVMLIYEKIPEITLYITGISCKLTRLTVTDNGYADGLVYDITGYSAFGATSEFAVPITLTGTSGESEWTATATSGFLDEVTLAAYNSSGVSFVKTTDYAVSTTFSLARVRGYTVFYDGTNGGTFAYKYSTTDDAVVTETSASGECYTTLKTETTFTNTHDITYYYESYELEGWYDIANNKYYEIGYTDAIAIEDNTVFYADWTVSDYDFASVNTANNTGHTVDGTDTSGFITTTVVDYNDLINLFSSDYTGTVTSSDHSESWYVVNLDGSSLSRLGNVSWGFVFYNGGMGTNVLMAPERGSDTYSINTHSQYSRSDRILDNLTANGISGFLKYLFNTDDSAYETYGKTSVGDGNYLFQYNEENGYYYYDAALNAASYGDGRFQLYNYTVSTYNGSGSTTAFLPFNEWSYNSDGDAYVATSRDLYNAAINYYFGMTVEISFYLPDDVGSYTEDDSGNKTYGNQSSVETEVEDGDTTTTYRDMIFQFTGDDDVWVMVDGYMVLDLGGIHGKEFGQINFSTGEVTIVDNGGTDMSEYLSREYSTDGNGIYTVTDNATSAKVVTTYYLSDLASQYGIEELSSGAHTLTIYYLERGAGESNFATYFNISSDIYSLDLSKVDESDSTQLEGAQFTFYTDSGFKELAELLTEKEGEETASTFTMPSTVYGLQEGVTYYVVETKAPDGYTSEGKYFTVRLDGSTLRIIVYDSTDSQLALYEYTIKYDDGGNCTVTRTDNYEGDSSSWNYLVIDESNCIEADVDSSTVAYYKVSFSIANTAEYELPATGSTGIQAYVFTGEALVLFAGVGLITLAFYQFVWVRKFRTDVNNKESTKDREKRRKRFARTRDHPRNLSVSHGHARDRPGGGGASSLRGGMERCRGTGPGSE